jgi:predicted thioesterase
MQPGVTASVEHVVGEDDTAVALGSGDVPVLGTPRVIALLEAASVAAVRDRLGDGQTTVGTRIEVDHLRPSQVGASVLARAALTSSEGRRLVFAVSLLAGDVELARGTVTRMVVDRARFLGPS